MRYIIICVLLFTSCSSQKNIIYSYELIVNESIMESLNDINKKLNIKDGDFKKIFAILSEGSGDVDIVFNNYEHMPKSVIKLIQQTHRFIRVDKNLKIPVLYQMDVASLTVKNERLPHLPYGGHLVKIDYKGTKVLKEGVLF